MPEVDKILEERGKKYGDFRSNAVLSQEIKALIRAARNEMPDEQVEALDLICTKISRIVTGDFTHADNWDDIAGYATLIANRLRKDQNAAVIKKAE